MKKLVKSGYIFVKLGTRVRVHQPHLAFCRLKNGNYKNPFIDGVIRGNSNNQYLIILIIK